jgi:hypothetical protein
MPPIAMGQLSTAPARPPVSTWLLAATLVAAAAISFLGFALYTRATSLPDETTPHAAANGSPIAATQVAAPIATPTPALPQSATAAATAPVVAEPANTVTGPLTVVPPKPAHPKINAPAAAPAPRHGAQPADDSDPLEGLIGERR